MDSHNITPSDWMYLSYGLVLGFYDLSVLYLEYIFHFADIQKGLQATFLLYSQVLQRADIDFIQPLK